MSGLQRETRETKSRDEANDFDGKTQFIRRRIIHPRWWTIPRRYILAIMCYLAFFIIGWMLMDLSLIFFHIISMDVEERLIHFPKSVHWTVSDIELMDSSYLWGYGASLIPGALIALTCSPHRTMAICVALTSVLHMLTALSLSYPIPVIITVFFLQGLASGPMICVCASIWREWAPPAEQTGLVILGYAGKFSHLFICLPVSAFFAESISPTGAYYVSGAAGLVWCLLWFIWIYDSPMNDPNISEAELLYLETKIPPENKETVSVKSIPVISILMSLPVLSLCIVNFSSSFALRTMTFASFMFFTELDTMDYDVNWILWTLGCSFVLVVAPSGFLSDIIMRKTKWHPTTMRKIFCSGGLILHGIVLFAALMPSIFTAVTFYVLSFIIHAFSIAGFMSNPLDLSTRYACVLVAIVDICSVLGLMTFDYVLPHFISDSKDPHKWKMSFVASGLISTVAALVFVVFGSAEEQPWSSRTIPFRTNAENSSCYPQTDNTENDLLVEENSL